jgi:alpha-tubulin suppressor-like RCC1 family protein
MSHTAVVRRTAALAGTLLLAAVLAPLGLAGPAGADAGGGVPGIPRADASTLAVGYQHACAILGDGSLRCWGANSYGQLGQGTTTDVGDNAGESTVAVDLGAGRTAVAVSAGEYHTCAVLDTGQLRCWGYNGEGQLGQGNTASIGDDPGETTVAVDLGPGRTAVAVAAGSRHTCAVLDTGQLRCWGANDYGQLGQGNTNNIGDNPGETPVAVDLGAGRKVVAVSAGYHTCAALDNGQLRCWGYNAFGQLGQGDTDNIGDNPGETTVSLDLGAGRTAVALSASTNDACVVLDTGQLRCWGYNGSGQLAQGGVNNIGDQPGETTAAVDLGPGRTATAVSVGYAHMCALLDTGQLRCWGINDFGQLGQGNTTSIGDSAGETTVAVDLGPGRTALAVGGGLHHTCAVLDTRQLRCWGRSDRGQLGKGNTASYGPNPGETPAAAPAVNLGGQSVGRDTDGDGVRDAVDACRTVAGTLPSGCNPPAAATPATPAPAPMAKPEAVLKGKKVFLDTVLMKKQPSAKCPAQATVVVKTKAETGRVKIARQLKSITVTGGCRVAGKVSLGVKPAKAAEVRVTVSGTKLETKHLTAVRP